MELHINDWVVRIDMESTMEISAMQAKDHCTCGYCSNFYRSFEAVCPQLCQLLGKLGIHWQGPDELAPFEPTIYEVSYIIQGQILRQGTPFSLDGIPIQLLTAEQADMETEHPAPYFVLVAGLIELPWLMEEDPGAVLSPANEKEYLQRMTDKLMARLEDDPICS